MNNVNRIESIPGCCGIRVYRGINNANWTLASFQKAITNVSFHKKALLINVAYGMGAGAAVGSHLDVPITKDKTTMLGRLDEITKWIEENDLGEIFEILVFKNPSYGMVQTVIWHTNLKTLPKMREKLLAGNWT